MVIKTQLRSVWSAARKRASDGADSGEEEEPPESHLFECSTCEVVYIDTEKETCSDCGSDVERI